jgi:tetratricopeptide (TPR) repeat protein
MNFRRYLTILVIFLAAVLVIQPVFAEGNVTKLVTNQTADLEKDVATKFYNAGEQSLVLGDFKNAITFFDQALAENTSLLKKTDALLYLYRDKAYAQIKMEQFNNASETLDNGISLYPNDAMLWNNKGYLLNTLGKPQDALRAYDTAISFDGNYTNAYINRGDVLRQLGRYPEAVAAYTKASQTDPGNSYIAENLAAAKAGEAESGRTMTIVLVIVLIIAIGIVIWYVKFRKPSEPAPEEKTGEKKKKSRKK